MKNNMKNHTNIKILIAFLVATFAINANAINELDKQRPDNIGDKKWSSLKAAVQENNSKLLPSPEGIGGASARFGESVSIDGNRALIGSPRALEHGVAYIFDYDGITWNETQLFFPDDINGENRFGIAVSLQGNRAVIGDQFNRVNGMIQSGAAYVYDLNNGIWELTQKLTASDAGSVDKFGSSVSLLGDRILIGATEYDDAINGNGSGAAYIFDYDGSIWQESAILTATAGSSGDGLGNAVSLDGDQALVAAINFDDNNNGINTGSAYLFELVGGTWSQTKQFLASDGVDNDKYGVSVAVSAGRVLIGASATDENFADSGSAYVYEFDGTLWIETKILAADATFGDRFGGAVSIENNRMMVGALSGDLTSVNTGTVYIFDYDTNTNQWNFTQEIAADDITGGTSSSFASSIGLSGNRVIVGNFQDRDNGSQSGAAYVFDLNGTWQQSQKVVTQGAADDNFGYAVSLDGNRALIGAPYDDNSNGSGAGNAYIFDYINGQWSAPIKLQASEFFQNFGMSVSLDGNTAIIGANRIEFASSGQAYIFEFDGSTWNQTALLESGIGNDEFAYAVSISGQRALVGSFAGNGVVNRSGIVYVYEKSINGWQQSDELMASDGLVNDAFGFSVSLFGDRAIVGAIEKDDDINGFSRAGAAYIYDYDSMNDLWIETKLQVSDPRSSDLLGSSVDLDANRAIVGARNGFGASSQTGSAYIFDYDTNTSSWSDTKILASDGQSSSQFGGSVSLDGDRALVGAYLARDNTIRSGLAYLYEYDGSSWNEIIRYTPNDAAESDNYGFSVSLSGSSVLIGSAQDDDQGTDSGSVYTIIDIDVLFSDGFEN